MGTKDITEKNLEAWNDVFADIVNVLLFNGQRLMKEEDLEADTKDSMFKADNEIHEQERDVSKFWKNGEIRISILGFENQTEQDYKMPLRVMGYDGASYKQQYLDNKLKKNYPVTTLVLYFGTQSVWTAPKNLLGCFNIPEQLKPFVSDYKINVFNIAWLSDEIIKMFKSDFRFVAEYFQTKRKNNKYIPPADDIRHIDSLLKMFTALTGDNHFESVYNNSNLKTKKGGVTMCDIVQGFVNEGRAEGIAEGAQQKAIEATINLLKMDKLSPEEIAHAQGLPLEQVLELQKNLFDRQQAI